MSRHYPKKRAKRNGKYLHGPRLQAVSEDINQRIELLGKCRNQANIMSLYMSMVMSLSKFNRINWFQVLETPLGDKSVFQSLLKVIGSTCTIEGSTH